MRRAQGDKQALKEGIHISQANIEFTAHYKHERIIPIINQSVVLILYPMQL